MGLKIRGVKSSETFACLSWTACKKRTLGTILLREQICACVSPAASVFVNPTNVDYPVTKSDLHSVELSLCQGSSAWFVCVLWHTTPFMSPRWIHFWPLDCITHCIHSHTHTINRTHSQQTNSPYSHTAVQMYHVFVLGGPQALPGQRLPLWSCFLTVSLLIRRAVLWSTIRPNPRLSKAQLQELQNGFIMCLRCLVRERQWREREWFDLY